MDELILSKNLEKEENQEIMELELFIQENVCLHLSNCLPNSFFNSFELLNNIKLLDVSNSTIGDELCAKLNSCTFHKLEYLDLRDSKLSDDGLNSILTCNFPSLWILLLGSRNIKSINNIDGLLSFAHAVSSIRKLNFRSKRDFLFSSDSYNLCFHDEESFVQNSNYFSASSLVQFLGKFKVVMTHNSTFILDIYLPSLIFDFEMFLSLFNPTNDDRYSLTLCADWILFSEATIKNMLGLLKNSKLTLNLIILEVIYSESIVKGSAGNIIMPPKIRKLKKRVQSSLISNANQSVVTSVGTLNLNQQSKSSDTHGEIIGCMSTIGVSKPRIFQSSLSGKRKVGNNKLLKKYLVPEISPLKFSSSLSQVKSSSDSVNNSSGSLVGSMSTYGVSQPKPLFKKQVKLPNSVLKLKHLRELNQSRDPI